MIPPRISNRRPSPKSLSSRKRKTRSGRGRIANERSICRNMALRPSIVGRFSSDLLDSLLVLLSLPWPSLYGCLSLYGYGCRWTGRLTAMHILSLCLSLYSVFCILYSVLPLYPISVLYCILLYPLFYRLCAILSMPRKRKKSFSTSPSLLHFLPTSISLSRPLSLHCTAASQEQVRKDLHHGYSGGKA